MEKLLVHACCAPCLCAVYEDIENNLREYNLSKLEDMDIIWYNVNIHPKVEYMHRMNTLKEFLELKSKKRDFFR